MAGIPLGFSMSLESETNTVSYSGNNSTITPYTIPFRFDANSWLEVSVVASDGTVTAYVLDTDFTVSGDGSTASASLTTAVAVAVTSTVRIKRATPATQTLDLTYNSTFPAATVEAQFDKMMMRIQDTKREADDVNARSFRVPDGETVADLPSASSRASKILFFDENGDPDPTAGSEVLATELAAAAASAAAASASEGNAASSAGAASASASSASTSASSASTSAGESAASAVLAASYAGASDSSRLSIYGQDLILTGTHTLLPANMGRQLFQSGGDLTLTLPLPGEAEYIGGLFEITTLGTVTFAGNPVTHAITGASVTEISGTLSRHILRATLDGWTIEASNPSEDFAEKDLSNVDPATGRTALGLGSTIYAADFGVTADGVTNETNVLQDALDAAAAVATAAQRVTLVLPAGVIRVKDTRDSGVSGGTHSITLKPYVSIVGQGIGQTIIKTHDDTAAGYSVLLGLNADHVQIRNLTIDGNKTRATTGGEDEGIDFKTSNNISVVNVEVRNCGMDGMDFDTCSNIIISNCFITDNGGAGIHGQYDYLTITGCIIQGNGAARILDADPAISNSAVGFDARNSNYVVVSGCVFRNNIREIGCYNSRITIANCTVHHTPATVRAGVLCWGTSTASVTKLVGCEIVIGSTGPAIHIIEGHGNVEVLDCSITTNGATGYGIQMDSGRYLRVSDCRLKVTAHGIWIKDANSTPADIRGTIFDGASGNLIRVESAGGGTVDGCTFRGGAVALHLFSNASGWSLLNSKSESTNLIFQTQDSASSGARVWNNFAAGDFSLKSGGHSFRGNTIRKVIFVNGSAITNYFEGNEFSSAPSFTTTDYGAQAWLNNRGAGISGVFSGTATLVAGTATVSTGAAYSGKRIRLLRQAAGGTIGHLSVGTITAGTSFVINSSSASDTSVIAWELLD